MQTDFNKCKFKNWIVMSKNRADWEKSITEAKVCIGLQYDLIFRANLVVHRQEHGIIYCTTQFGTTVPIVPNCVIQYITICRAPDDERLDSLEKCRADKKLWNKN